MPEGDTIYRAAQTLHRALAGKRVTRFETVLPRLARIDEDRPLAGRTVERVVSAGKHLIFEFSGDLHLRTHLRMNGSWHIYRPGERWQRRRIDMRIVVATDDFVAVGFNIPIAEFHDTQSLARQEDLRKIGPDLLGETFDVAEAVRRARERNDREIADVLLNQRVLAGIGNVFKSEVLFLCNVNPFAKVRTLDDATLTALMQTSEKLLRRNVLPGAKERRTTRTSQPDAPLYVYGRENKPCTKCGTMISMRKQGPDARVTFWCMKCQAER